MGVAVIGGAGFIGSNLVDELMVQGFEVTVLDDLSTGKMENLTRWKNHSKLEFIKASVLDRRAVASACDHKSWVFHLAAMSRVQPSVEDPYQAFETNVMGTVNVLDACRRREVKRVVYTNTCAVYGTTDEPSKETDPLHPESPYAQSKLAGEQACDLFRELYGLPVVSLRLFNVYGPRAPESGAYALAIPIFRRQAREWQPITVVGDGEQRRDYVFVGDVVRAFMLAAMNYEATGAINIGSGVSRSVNEVASLIGKEHPTVNIPTRLGESRFVQADIHKAREVLGWKPAVNLHDGLAILDRFEELSHPSIVITSR